MRINLSKNNLRISFPEIAKQWHPTKNGDLKPENVTRAKNKEVWWLCSKGHEWIALISNRTRKKSGCPYCSGRKPTSINNFKILFPDIAKEWHPTKNADLKPENLTKGNPKKVWWLCSKGHEWIAAVGSRTAKIGTGCPYCANKKASTTNNLKFLFPEIAKEWHPTKNGDLKAEDVVKKSGKKVWWLCAKNHEWKTSVNSRTDSKSNCPKCNFQSSRPEFRILSELETLFKKVDSGHKYKKTEIDIYITDINVGIEYDGSYFHKNREINDEKKNIFLKKNLIKLIRVRHKPLEKLSKNDVIVENDNLTKKDLDNIINSIIIFCDSKQKKILNNYLKYKSFINEKGYKKYLSYFPSPIPSRSLALTNSKLAKEWNYKKNYPLNPESFYSNSGNRVWWLCSKGHEWETRIASRTSKIGTGCPFCSNKKVSDTNNFEYNFPQLAKEWHPKKNNDLKPHDFTRGSNKKVWWQCLKGHEWETTIHNRSIGKGCPYCLKHYPSLFKIRKKIINK